MHLIKYLKHTITKILIGTSICCLAALLIVQHHFFKSNPTKPDAKQPAKVVETVVLSRQNMQQTIRLLGTIKPKHAATLTAHGFGSLDIRVATGQTVKKGTLLAKISNPELEHHLKLTRHAETLARSQLERFNKLVHKGFVSAREIEEKKQALIQSQKELSKAKIEANDLNFYAPFNGVVGAFKKREGTLVSTGEAVVTLFDPSSLIIEVDIPCTNLPSVHKGSSVTVLGKQYPLSHFQEMLDETTHMCPADIEMTCQSCLMGETVPVELVAAERKNTLILPFQALILKESKPYVFVVDNGKLVLQAVKTGIQQQDKIEILEGLTPGTQVVVKGQQRLAPGMEVTVYAPKNTPAKT